MANYILADNQDLTRFATETLIRQKDANCNVRRAADKARLTQLLMEAENSVVVIDFTLFDIIDDEQLLIISERFNMATWILISDYLTDSFLRRVVYSSNAFSIVFKSQGNVGLTSTETEIVKAIARGLTTKEIAAERFSSVHTIATHRKNIFRKLKVNTAHEVIKYAMRAGLVNPSEFYI